MSRKLTYEFVKESFEKEGYVLLSKEYVNSKQKLDYICSKGHKHNIMWNSWKTGHRCPYCAINAKLTLEHVQKQFEKEGYTLLSKEYVNAHIKLNYICSKKHEHDITWDKWQQGVRCPYCYGNTKPTLEQIRESFEQENYILLSKEYINSYTKLEYICSKGHKHNISWDDWQQHTRCPTCANIRTSIRISGSGHPNWKGGSSYEPYCSVWKDKEYKKDIRDRDGNKCLNPYCNKKSDKLHIHHIDYDKKNCCPSNLITVCNSCNAKANTDREWHKVWYQAIIKNRYGGIS